MNKKYLLPLLFVFVILTSSALLSAQYNTTLNQGWNLLSFPLDPLDQNTNKTISLNQGWNIIGYSSDNPLLWDSAIFNNGTHTKNTTSASSSNWIQYSLYYYEDNSYKLVPGNDNYLRKGKAYWLYSLEPNLELILPNAGGSVQTYYNKFYWPNVYITKDNETKTIDDAELSSWIQRTIYEFDQDYNLITDYTDPWKGYWLYAFEDNLTLSMEYSVSGTIYDMDTGDPLPGVNISFYPASTYNPFNGNGNYSALVPKQVPDIITDENGNYYASLPDGVYHMVMQGSDEKDFNVHANKGKGKLKKDPELDEDSNTTNFNAEGHILHSGEYEHQGNKYVCGSTVDFTMFGVNNGQTDETITFLVQDHTQSGNPHSPIVYYGNISNQNESLTVPAGNKTHKNFEFKVPCSYEEGKYDIHVVWNNEKWHKIGNFFVIPDNTAPEVNVQSDTWTYTNQTVSIEYAAFDPAEPGTIEFYRIFVGGFTDDSVSVTIDKDITMDGDDIDTIIDNDADYVGLGGSMKSVNLTYGTSGHYTARFIVTDDAGNSDYEDINIDVYITEDEADVIGSSLYTLFGIDWDFQYDQNITSSPASPTQTLGVDRWDEFSRIADEYSTPEDGFDENTKSSLDQVINNCDGPNYIKTIGLSTYTEFNQSLYAYFMDIQCRCNKNPWFGAPPCP